MNPKQTKNTKTIKVTLEHILAAETRARKSEKRYNEEIINLTKRIQTLTPNQDHDIRVLRDEVPDLHEYIQTDVL